MPGKPVLAALFPLLVLASSAALASASCYLPTEANVSYQSVTELAVSSPAEVIAYGPDALQFGELWLSDPEKPAPPSPLVVMIHGGCWLNTYDIKHTHALSMALASSGYAVWSVEYRRSGDAGGGWPGSFEDVLAAVRFISQLDNEQIDQSRVALIGHSAGGHLALLAGSELAADNTISLAVVIGLAPITDIGRYAQGDSSCQQAALPFFGGTAEQNPEQYAAANPALKTLHPKSVSIHGDRDNIVPLAQSTESVLPVRIIGGAGHFDMLHPRTPAFQALLKELAAAFAAGT